MDKRLRHIALLRCFESAARHQSYSKAAVELSITQAAVSQQIRNLEQHLAVTLFTRVGRNMLLTKQGKTLFDYVGQAFVLLSEGFDRIKYEPEDGVLTVTAPPSFSSIWLVPRLWKFSSQHPNITVRAIASQQIEDLRHTDIDIAIRQTEKVVADVYSELLISDAVYPYCSPELVKDVNLDSPEKLKDCWLVEAIDPGLHSWKNWFVAANVDVQEDLLSWIEVTTWEMGINAVVSGHGVCLASESMASQLVERGVLVCPFKIPTQHHLKFHLLYDESSPKKSRINIFRDWLRSEVADLKGSQL